MYKQNLFRYTIHNLIGHPMMELFHLIGMNKVAWKIHEITLPKDDRGNEIKQVIEAGEYFKLP